MPNTPGNNDRTTDSSEQAGANGNAQAGNAQNGAGAGDASSSARGRSNRGFASMDRSKQKEIASKGGRAAHAKGTAHEFDSGEARDAGRKGGVAVSRNREHMAAIGRRGGEARGHARGVAASQNSGATNGAEGGLQNSRVANASPSTPTGSDRQVAIDNQREGMSTRSVSGNDRSNTGAERRPMTDNSANASRDNESFGKR